MEFPFNPTFHDQNISMSLIPLPTAPNTNRWANDFAHFETAEDREKA